MMRGYLPMDRENFQGSLLGARDREYAVCRLKPKLLQNMRASREAPNTFVCDEQIDPYFGSKSGAKKRMAKKTCEGLEYFTLATTNKEYEGYKYEIREPTTEEKEGAVIQNADPVSGGFTLNYEMEGGRKYEIDLTAPSNTFGKMILLIFQCGTYLRYQNACLVTDSAYGFLSGMVFLQLWEIMWVTSLRIAQRAGFLGIEEFRKGALDELRNKPGVAAVSEESKENKKKNKFSKEIKRWEKERTKSRMGTS